MRPLLFFQTTVKTRHAIFSLDFPTGSFVDGELLPVEQVDLVTVPFFHPIGSRDFINTINPSIYLDPGPLESQYVSLDWNLYTKIPNRNGTYDPGVSIQLLFEPEVLPPSAAKTEEGTVGLIVGLTVGIGAAIIIGVAVACVVRKVTPFKGQREQATSSLQDVDEPNDPSERLKSSWASGVKPDSPRS